MMRYCVTERNAERADVIAFWEKLEKNEQEVVYFKKGEELGATNTSTES